MRVDRRTRAVARRRAVALGALAATAVGVAIAASGGGGSSVQSAPSPALVRIRLDGLTLAQRRVSELGHLRAVSTLLEAVPATRTVRNGSATVEFRVERERLARELDRAVRQGGGDVVVREMPSASSIRVPLIKQVLQDDCEATALAMILAYRGKRVGQLTLQAQVAHSKPLDPAVSASGSEIWGNPNLGFVGRADGGGPAGGFGVYQRPIEALARRHGVLLDDLTGAGPTVLYRALLSGRPVMAWVALSNGPFASWQTPSGHTVRVNYGEHAVVLTGVGRGGVSLNDPLSGRRLTWAKPQFEQMWAALGHRALSA